MEYRKAVAITTALRGFMVQRKKRSLCGTTRLPELSTVGSKSIKSCWVFGRTQLAIKASNSARAMFVSGMNGVALEKVTLDPNTVKALFSTVESDSRLVGNTKAEKSVMLVISSSAPAFVSALKKTQANMTATKVVATDNK